MSNIVEIISFLFIAIIVYVAALSDTILYQISGFNKEIFPYVIAICVSIFALTGMFWYLLLKVSKDSKLKTDLLLSKQREEMYKNSVLSTNEHIEKLAKVKHDIKNNTMTISRLISSGEYDSAKELCKKGFYRAAGAICGVVIEKHLSEVCTQHQIKVTKKNPTINDYNELLKANNIVDIATWRNIQRLADVRNMCDHHKDVEPTKDNIEELIAGTDKMLKTIF